MARLCARPGCRLLGPHSHRASSTERGFGADWQKIRARKLREEPLCRICIEVLGMVTAATAVDHIVPRSRGGTNAWSNLQPICKPHNDAKGDRDNAEFRASLKRPA